MTIKAVTNAEQVGTYVREAGARVSPEVRTAMERTATQMLRQARKLSSGTLTYEALRQLGHPYRRGGPNPLDAAVINAHRGKFKAGWKKRVYTSPGRKGGEGVTIKLWNDSDVAKYMRGTKRMIHRPIVKKVIQDVMPAYRQEIRSAMRRALAGQAVRGAIGRGASGARGGFVSGARRGFAATQGV